MRDLFQAVILSLVLCSCTFGDPSAGKAAGDAKTLAPGAIKPCAVDVDGRTMADMQELKRQKYCRNTEQGAPDAQKVFDEAQEKFKAKDYEQAEKLFYEYITFGPWYYQSKNVGYAYHAIAHCQYNLKEGDLGAQAFTRAAIHGDAAAKLEEAELAFAQKLYERANDSYLYFFNPNEGYDRKLPYPNPDKYMCSIDSTRVGQQELVCAHAFVAALKSFQSGKATTGFRHMDEIPQAMFDDGFLSEDKHLMPLLAEIDKAAKDFAAKHDIEQERWCLAMENYFLTKMRSSSKEALAAKERLANMDKKVCLAIRQAIAADRDISVRSQDISVLSDGGNVKLAGLVASSQDLDEIEKVVNLLPGVVHVDNKLRFRRKDGQEESSNVVYMRSVRRVEDKVPEHSEWCPNAKSP